MYIKSRFWIAHIYTSFRWRGGLVTAAAPHPLFPLVSMQYFCCMLIVFLGGLC